MAVVRQPDEFDAPHLFQRPLDPPTKELTTAAWEQRKEAIKRGELQATDADRDRMAQDDEVRRIAGAK